MLINTGKPFFPGGPAGPCKTYIDVAFHENSIIHDIKYNTYGL
jgi:hypothetical protein